MSKNKLKIAFYWAASCGGCEIAVLDINEKILDVVQIADIVFWPVALDIKYKDVEAMPDKYIDITFFNGSIRNSEQEEMAKLLRQKSKTLVAFGSCAHEGCIPGLANLHDSKEILEYVYQKQKGLVNPEGTIPKPETKVKEGILEIPKFYDTVKSARAQTVDVDYYLPGCPPPVKLIADAIDAIAKNELPPKGSILAPLKAVCDECPRTRENKKITKLYRVYEKALVKNVNLIVATTNNYPAICMSIRDAAKGLIHGGKVDQGVLNKVEMAFRAYDPCFACATHVAVGQMPLTVEVYDSQKNLLQTLQR
jgi:F420-non-reducing hydrogenase small subunit